MDPGTAASVERAGARFTMIVETNPLFGTRPSWIVVSLENRGANEMHWLTDACEFHEGVSAVSAAAWAPGVAHTGVAGEFKAYALGKAEPPIRFALTPESLIGRGVGCPDIGIVRSLGPGERIIERTRWEGESEFGKGVGPGTPVHLRATFASPGWHRGSEAEFRRAGLSVDLVVGVDGGRDPAFLSPGQAIDVALQSVAFRAFLEDHFSRVSVETLILLADSDSAMWQVGLETLDGRRMVVVLDGLLGTIIEVIGA